MQSRLLQWDPMNDDEVRCVDDDDDGSSWLPHGIERLLPLRTNWPWDLEPLLQRTCQRRRTRLSLKDDDGDDVWSL